MSKLEQQSRGPDVAEMLQATIGPEADYYLQEMHGLEPSRFAVIKVGGETVEQDLDSLASDIAMLTNLGLYPVIVHGGSSQINADLKARGITPKMLGGIRVTDKDTLGSVQRGLAQVNQTIAEALSSRGVEAIGINEGVFTANYKDREALGFVGEVERVKDDVIKQAINEGKVPVVSCLGHDREGHPLNINADTSASALGTALQTHKFIMLSNVPGVLGRNGQLLSVINDTQEVQAMIVDGTISEGMIPKVEKGLRALQDLPNESSVVITNPQQLIRELFTHQGGGTLLRHGDAITHLPSVKAVDQQAVRELVERAFGKHLVDDYFEQLPDDAEVFITDRGYRGIAIALPSQNGNPAYVDKFAVLPEEWGHGIGDELIDKVLEEHPEGAYWRVNRLNNRALSWNRSKGRGQEYDWVDDEWIVFFTKEVKPDDRARYAAMAVLKEQTTRPTV